VTPDRIDANPDENAEHGVLDESGNLDTASITILGGHIAQVSVDLPVTSHDDDIDDDVVEDEVPVDEAEIRSFETIGQPFTLDGGNGAPALTYVPEPQTDPQPTVQDDVHVEHLPTGDIILEPHDDADADSDGEVHDEPEVHDAEIVEESEGESGDAFEGEPESEDAAEASSRDDLVVAGFDEDRVEPRIILSTDGFDPAPVTPFVLSTDVFEPEDLDGEPADDVRAQDVRAEDDRAEDERAEDERAEDERAEDVDAQHDVVDDERAGDELVGDELVDDLRADDQRADDEPADVEPDGDERPVDDHTGDEPAQSTDAESTGAVDADLESAHTGAVETESVEAEYVDAESADADIAEAELSRADPAAEDFTAEDLDDDLAEDEFARRELADQEAAEPESGEHPGDEATPVEADRAADELTENDEREQNEADMSHDRTHEPVSSADESNAIEATTFVNEPHGAEIASSDAADADVEPAEPAAAPTASAPTDGTPTTTGAVPSATGAVATSTGTVPATTGTVPATTGTVPATTGTVPAGAVATTTGAIPRTRAERAATGAIGTVPLTRRGAHQADEAARVGRAHAAERVRTPGPDLALTSKRSSAIDDTRESPDLLTADRLLDPRQVARPEPEGLWQQLVYSMSGRRINLGDGRRARQRKELDRRIAAPLAGGARFVPVLSRKGGVGKTTVTSLLGMALADARDDRVIAVDANPDRGTLADRVGRPNGRTVRDLVRAHDEVDGYHDVSSIVARDATRLDVLASDSDPRVSEAFSDDDYRQVADVAAHYYSIVLTDTGTGIVHSVMEATLERADSLVVVAGLSVDEARLASETLTWLETNGYADRVRSAVVVINSARPGTPLVRESELEAHFRTRVQTVIRMPYDPRIAAGSAISFRDLSPETRLAARQLAAAVVEGLRAPVAAA
jgi:MinD-like ATPase involved in chromosome partitioning or flagellar assembly